MCLKTDGQQFQILVLSLTSGIFESHTISLSLSFSTGKLDKILFHMGAVDLT